MFYRSSDARLRQQYICMAASVLALPAAQAALQARAACELPPPGATDSQQVQSCGGRHAGRCTPHLARQMHPAPIQFAMAWVRPLP